MCHRPTSAVIRQTRGAIRPPVGSSNCRCAGTTNRRGHWEAGGKKPTTCFFGRLHVPETRMAYNYSVSLSSSKRACDW
jgi:hypothetical protein